MSRRGYEKRLSDIQEFYAILRRLEQQLGGKRTLAESHGRMQWPERGVYFFFERGERRTTSDSGPRVVRVGTHAFKAGSRSTLWKRLRQHRGEAAPFTVPLAHRVVIADLRSEVTEAARLPVKVPL